MRTRIDNSTNNIIKKMTKGRRVDNKGIINISMVKLGELVSHLNNFVRIHKIKIRRKIGASNILKLKQNDKKRRKWNKKGTDKKFDNIISRESNSTPSMGK